MASSVAAMSSWTGTSALSSSSSSSSSPPAPPTSHALLLRKPESSLRLAAIQGFGSSLSTVRRRGSLCVRAAGPRGVPPPRGSGFGPTEEATTDPSKQFQDFVDDLKARYDAMENKSTVWIYGGGALIALWFASSVLSAINTLPLFPKLLEFIGICYTSWFIYRYVLFKSSRKQLAADIEDLKLKITGSTRRDTFFPDDSESP